ncbi:MAG: hypothetical protein AAFX79_11385 [Planctomycetota bacterium]
MEQGVLHRLRDVMIHALADTAKAGVILFINGLALLALFPVTWLVAVPVVILIAGSLACLWLGRGSPVSRPRGMLLLVGSLLCAAVAAAWAIVVPIERLERGSYLVVSLGASPIDSRRVLVEGPGTTRRAAWYVSNPTRRWWIRANRSRLDRVFVVVEEKLYAGDRYLEVPIPRLLAEVEVSTAASTSLVSLYFPTIMTHYVLGFSKNAEGEFAGPSAARGLTVGKLIDFSYIATPDTPSWNAVARGEAEGAAVTEYIVCLREGLAELSKGDVSGCMRWLAIGADLSPSDWELVRIKALEAAVARRRLAGEIGQSQANSLGRTGYQILRTTLQRSPQVATHPMIWWAERELSRACTMQTQKGTASLVPPLDRSYVRARISSSLMRDGGVFDRRRLAWTYSKASFADKLEAAAGGTETERIHFAMWYLDEVLEQVLDSLAAAMRGEGTVEQQRAGIEALRLEWDRVRGELHEIEDRIGYTMPPVLAARVELIDPAIAWLEQEYLPQLDRRHSSGEQAPAAYDSYLSNFTIFFSLPGDRALPDITLVETSAKLLEPMLPPGLAELIARDWPAIADGFGPGGAWWSDEAIEWLAVSLFVGTMAKHVEHLTPEDARAVADLRQKLIVEHLDAHGLGVLAYDEAGQGVVSCPGILFAVIDALFGDPTYEPERSTLNQLFESAVGHDAIDYIEMVNR